IAQRAGIAAGTIYRYFPSKTELVLALTAALAKEEIAAVESAANRAPGPLSALTTAIMVFALRAVGRRRLSFALMTATSEPDLDHASKSYRSTLTAQFEKLIRRAVDAGQLPDQDAGLAVPA